MIPLEPALPTESPPPTGAVLAIDRAMAVLIETTGVDRPQRDGEVAARLRMLTGNGTIAIDRRPSGRPRLAPPLPELGISLARRHDLVLAGFSPTHRVGVDLEPDDAALDHAALARDHFSAAEARAVATAASPEIARDLFMRLWVVKEAALKLTGRGVFDGMREPDCAAALYLLVHDGSVVGIPAGRGLPAVRIAIRRCRVGPSHVYCALAVEA